MGLHDLSPPPGVRVKAGVLKFFRRHFDNTEDPSPEAAIAFSEAFTPDAIWIHTHNERYVGPEAIRQLKLAKTPPGTYRSIKLGEIYPLNQGVLSDAQVYLINGSATQISTTGRRDLIDFRCSVTLVDVAGVGLKIKLWNTMGFTAVDDCFQGVFSGLGMFMY